MNVEDEYYREKSPNCLAVRIFFLIFAASLRGLRRVAACQKGDRHRGKLKSFVPSWESGKFTYEGASLKAVLPVVYMYAYLFYKGNGSHIYQQV